jgi:hypothetical protein
MMKRKRLKYVAYNYYLGGVISVLNKIEAAFGVNTIPAQTAILHVKAAMRDKHARLQNRKGKKK